MTQTVDLGGNRNVEPITIQFRIGHEDDGTPNSGVYVTPSQGFDITIDETTKVHIVRIGSDKQQLNVPIVGFMRRLVVSSVAIDGPFTMATLIPEHYNATIEPIGLTILAAHFVVKSDVGLGAVLPGETYLVIVDCSESMRKEPVPEEPAPEVSDPNHPRDPVTDKVDNPSEEG